MVRRQEGLALRRDVSGVLRRRWQHALPGPVAHSTGHDAHHAEDLRVLEAQVPGTETAHRKTFHRPRLAFRQRPVRLVHMRDQLLDDHAFHRPFAAGLVAVEARAAAVHQHHDHRRRLAVVDGLVQRPHKHRPGARIAAVAVQPVHHGIPSHRVRLVARREVNQIAHLAIDQGAAEGPVVRARRFAPVRVQPVRRRGARALRRLRTGVLRQHRQRGQGQAQAGAAKHPARDRRTKPGMNHRGVHMDDRKTG